MCNQIRLDLIHNLHHLTHLFPYSFFSNQNSVWCFLLFDCSSWWCLLIAFSFFRRLSISRLIWLLLSERRWWTRFHFFLPASSHSFRRLELARSWFQWMFDILICSLRRSKLFRVTLLLDLFRNHGSNWFWCSSYYFSHELESFSTLDAFLHRSFHNTRFMIVMTTTLWTWKDHILSNVWVQGCTTETGSHQFWLQSSTL